ncbi:imidazole glycerol phosphate synthase subunit HisH [candidate division KSB1 bacterium]|nr:imidazole glycerol phosphate synthase subunit HisH [candidate division KSB1 bacterium]
MIAIVDYGAGNLRSVKKAFDFLGVANKVVSTVDEARYIEKIVLPGVGAFGMAAERLKESGFFEFLKQWLYLNKPFLGICLGLQLLFEDSEESDGIEGLAAFKGGNLRFTNGKVPQIGWNQIHIKKKSKLLDGIADRTFFYLVHSYYIAPKNDEIVIATTDYGVDYPTIIESGNIYAVQFHPEKSGDSGLQLLKNWVEKC